jgi:hypothetical protein
LAPQQKKKRKGYVPLPPPAPKHVKRNAAADMREVAGRLADIESSIGAPPKVCAASTRKQAERHVRYILEWIVCRKRAQQGSNEDPTPEEMDRLCEEQTTSLIKNGLTGDLATPGFWITLFHYRAIKGMGLVSIFRAERPRHSSLTHRSNSLHICLCRRQISKGFLRTALPVVLGHASAPRTFSVPLSATATTAAHQSNDSVETPGADQRANDDQDGGEARQTTAAAVDAADASAVLSHTEKEIVNGLEPPGPNDTPIALLTLHKKVYDAKLGLTLLGVKFEESLFGTVRKVSRGRAQ